MKIPAFVRIACAVSCIGLTGLSLVPVEVAAQGAG